MTEEQHERLRAALARRSAGPFHFPEIYGAGWERLPIGEKVRMGRDFQRAVDSGIFPGVTDTGRKRGGGRLYIKDC